MTLPKKGMRKLEYGGVNYGWLIRRKPTYSQAIQDSMMTLAIQSLDAESPQVLHVTLTMDRPDNWIDPHQTQIRPQEIRSIIDRAIENNWKAESGGRAFELEYSVIKHT